MNRVCHFFLHDMVQDALYLASRATGSLVPTLPRRPVFDCRLAGDQMLDGGKV